MDFVGSRQFGEALMKARVARDLAREDLAHMLGVRTSTVYRIERGLVSPSYDTVRAVARVLPEVMQRPDLDPDAVEIAEWLPTAAPTLRAMVVAAYREARRIERYGGVPKKRRAAPVKKRSERG